jgi:polyisoprenoid-binding protein YceI
MKLKFAVIVSALALFAGIGAQAQTSTWTIDPNHSSVNFSIRHMGVSTVHGALSGIKGTVTLDENNMANSNVQATIDTTTLSTGVEARDKHLKSPDFFDVAQFPTITFKNAMVMKMGGKLQLMGDLTLHGVTKNVTFDLDGPATPQKGPGGKTISGFSASGTLKRSDFGIGAKFPSGVVGDDVKFTIDVEVDKQ